jgi:hypothetical protein
MATAAFRSRQEIWTALVMERKMQRAFQFIYLKVCGIQVWSQNLVTKIYGREVRSVEKSMGGGDSERAEEHSESTGSTEIPPGAPMPGNQGRTTI